MEGISQVYHAILEAETQSIQEKLQSLQGEMATQEQFAQNWAMRMGVYRKTKRQVAIEEEKAKLQRRLEDLEAKMAHSYWVPSDVRDALLALGLSLDQAKGDELKEAYRKMAKQYHPDAGGNTEKMKNINSAYRCVQNWITKA